MIESVMLGGIVTVVVLTMVAVARHGWTTQRGPRRQAPDLVAELERARRYERCFTILRLEGSGRTPRGLRRLEASHRSTDHVWWDDDGDVYILAPELTAEHVTDLVARLTTIGAASRGGVRAATFPTDGLTLPALFLHLAEPSTDDASRPAGVDLARNAS